MDTITRCTLLLHP